MAGTREVTVKVYLTDEDERKAERLKDLITEYADEAFRDASVEEVVARALSYKAREALNEEFENYEWMENFVRRHPEVPIGKRRLPKEEGQEIGKEKGTKC